MIQAFVSAALLAAGTASVADCPAHLLVSGYGSDNVHVFDACDGRFLERVDKGGRIDGAQGLTVDGAGRLYVVSEENGRVLRYRASDYEFIDILAGPGGRAPLSIDMPTGIAIGAGGDVFVVGFRSNDVVRLDPETGAELAHYGLEAGGLAGADAGIAFLSDGRLLVPGFDSGNVVALDPDSGAVEEFVAAGTGGLVNPRVVWLDDAENRVLVSSWGSNRVLAFDIAGKPIGVVLHAAAPTGFQPRADGGWLVTSDARPRVTIFDRAGDAGAELISADNGGLEGATFLYRLETAGVSRSVSSLRLDSEPANR